jgi:hypothetical protein
MLEPILQDTSRHLDAATAASLTIDKIFTPLMITKALDAIRKGTMPGGTGITTAMYDRPPRTQGVAQAHGGTPRAPRTQIIW